MYVCYSFARKGRFKYLQVIDVDEPKPANAPIIPDDEEDDIVPEEVTFDCQNLLPSWHSFALHPQLTKSLHHNNFPSPTPIQNAAVPVALKQRDVVGVAQTVCLSICYIHYPQSLLGFRQNSGVRASHPAQAAIDSTAETFIQPPSNSSSSTSSHS